MPEASAAGAPPARNLEFGFIGSKFDPWEFFTILAAQSPALDKTTNLNAVLQKAYNAGVESIRFPILWSDIETSRGNYNWTNLDLFVNRATAYGFKLVPDVLNAPAWARSGNYTAGQQSQSGQSGFGKPNNVWSLTDTQTFATVQEANSFLARFQNAAKLGIPSDNQYYADFMAVLATRYGSGSPAAVSKSVTGASGSNIITLASGATNSGIAVGQTVSQLNGIGTNAVVTSIGTLSTSGNITNVVATAASGQTPATIRYTCTHTFTAGQVVNINGITGTSSFATSVNLSNAVISAVGGTGSSAWFEVLGSATGTYSTSTGTAFTNSVTLSVANSGAVSGSATFTPQVASFWADSDHTKTINCSTANGKNFTASLDSTLPSNVIGWSITGTGIATSTIIDGNTSGSKALRLNKTMTGASDSNAYTLKAPRITNWQIWNEPNLAREHEITIQIGDQAAQTFGKGNLPGFTLGPNWPLHQSKIYQFGTTATNGKYPLSLQPNTGWSVTNNGVTTSYPMWNNEGWALSFVDLSFKARASIKNVDSNATVILGGLASGNWWNDIDLIYTPSSSVTNPTVTLTLTDIKSAFDVFAVNFYEQSNNYAGQFSGNKAGNSTKLGSSVAQNATTIIVNEWPPYPTKNGGKTPKSSYAIIGGTLLNSNTEIVKITNAVQNNDKKQTWTLTVTRNAFNSGSKSFASGVNVFSWYPGLNNYLKTKYTDSQISAGDVPKIALTEYGQDSQPASNSPKSIQDARNAQSKANSSILLSIIPNKSLWNLMGAYQFCLTSTDTGSSQWDYSGMIEIKSDGTLKDKPALSQFAKDAKGSNKTAEVRT